MTAAPEFVALAFNAAREAQVLTGGNHDFVGNVVYATMIGTVCVAEPDANPPASVAMHVTLTRANIDREPLIAKGLLASAVTYDTGADARDVTYDIARLADVYDIGPTREAALAALFQRLGIPRVARDRRRGRSRKHSA